MRRYPDLAFVRSNPGGAVHRLHAGMREEWRAVDRFHLLGSFGDSFERVTVLAAAVGFGRGEALFEAGRDRRI